MQNVELFKEVMSRFPTGVTIVTGAEATGNPVGFTANAVAAVSLEPRLVLVCVDRSSASLEVLLRTGSFGLSVLRADQEALALRFADDVRDQRFDGLEVLATSLGPPVLEAALAWMSCRIWKRVEGGDHIVLIGEVVDAGVNPDGAALVFFRRGYGPTTGQPSD